MLMVMVTILMLEIICIFFAQTRGLQTRIAANRVERLKTFYLAEAGIAHGLWRIQEDPNWRFPMDGLALGEGAYSVSFAENAPNRQIIISSRSTVRGMTSAATRTVHWLMIQPPHGSDIEEADTYLKEDDKNGVKDDKNELMLDSENNKRLRTLVRFNPGKYPFPPEFSVIAGRFSMYLYQPDKDDDFINKGIVNDSYRIHRVTNEWWPHETAWDYRNKDLHLFWTTPGGDFDPNDVEDSVTFKTMGWKSWKVTRMTRYWIENPLQNYGFIIEADTLDDNNECKFYSSKSDQVTLRPKLTIYYLDARCP